MRLKLVSCEIFLREMCAVIARSKNQIDIAFLPKGLHDLQKEKMLPRVQEAVDAVDASQYDAVLLGYALCNNGIVGLTAREIPIVVPRAHDCITLFLGSKERYMEYFTNNTGTYFQTTGWLERGKDAGELRQQSVTHQMGLDVTFDQLVAKHGEEKARYVWEKLGDLWRHYKQFTFIEMGVEPDDRFEREVRAEAEQRGWTFEKVQGDMRLFRQLVDGEWDNNDFLVVRPGHRVVARMNEGIIDSEPAGNG